MTWLADRPNLDFSPPVFCQLPLPMVDSRPHADQGLHAQLAGFLQNRALDAHHDKDPVTQQLADQCRAVYSQSL